MTTLPEAIKDLIARNALFVINHSGGKDSQAMTAYMYSHIPPEQMVIIHAHLPGVEWDGTWEHVVENNFGLPTYQVQANKTFFDMVEHRGMFPSPSYRQCTSDLKRGPIEKQIRQILKDRNQSLIVNCMGLRAEESSARSKKNPFVFNQGNSIAGREWYDWLPIFDWKLPQVWEQISEAGQQPHWAYSKGMTRLSCCFCIMSSQHDLKVAAKENPELYQRYIDTEERLQFTLQMNGKEKKWLKDLLKKPVTTQTSLFEESCF